MLDDNSTFAGRYHVVRRLASGGMGAVYEARHLETGRACALKVMLAHVAENANARERFRLEARAAALVSSAHVVDVLDAGVDSATGSPFLVMELLRGEDLGSRVARLGPFPRNEVAAFLVQAARGLDALHRASIVHRDLKPSNLFLAQREGEESIVKVLDLGVAKRVADSAATTAVVGTPLYMAPEQISNGKISPATDVYALGMVAYSLLVGREYWVKEADTATSSIALALLTLDGPKEAATERAAQWGVTLPAAFDVWFVRATAADPNARFPGVVDAATELCVALGVEADELRIDQQRKSSEDTRLPKFDAFAPTVAEVAADKPPVVTLSLAENRPLKAPNVVRIHDETASLDEPVKKPQWRRALKVAASLTVAAAVAGAFVLRTKKTSDALPVVEVIQVIEAIECAPAEMTGRDVPPTLGRVLGQGACARLGIEMGTRWNEAGGTRLSVRAEMHEDRSAHVTLEMAGRKSDADGKTLIGATNAAIQKLAPMIPVAPMPPERIAAWGARDAASARRIERAVRQKAFGFADRKAIAEKLVASDGDSPVPHMMLACASKNTDKALAIAEKKETLKRIELLSPKRAKLVRSNLTDFIPTPDDPQQAPNIGDSYAELAEDPDFASLYTMCGCVWTDASLPMVDWLAKHAPVMGLPILPCSMGFDNEGRERVEKYLAWMETILPEWHGKNLAQLVHAGKLDEARKTLIVTEWLGHELTTRTDIAHSKALLAFAAYEPQDALVAAEELMGEPDKDKRHEGALQRIDALLFAGKIRAAEQAADSEINMFARENEDASVLALASQQLRMRRLLGRAGPRAEEIRVIDEAIARSEIRDQPSAHVERALLLVRETPSTNFGPVLAILERLSKSGMSDNGIGSYSVPALRVARGNEAAAARYREISLNIPRVKAAFEAALILEAIGSKSEAEKAYRLCTEQPWYYPFESIAARLRLAEMVRAHGREDEAVALMKIVDKAWADADPDLRELVRRMK